MTTYRVIKRTPLSTGQEQGDLVDSSRFKQSTLDRLIISGTIAEVFMPPLAELPGWAGRAARLEPLGIVTVNDLIESDAETIKAIKKEFKYRTITPIKRWQEEALQWLKPAKSKPIKRS